MSSRRLRTASSAVLIVLSCLLVPLGALAAWAAYGLTDTGRYVATMAPLAGDPAVQGQIADTVGEGILRQVGTGTAHGAMGPFVHDAVRSFTQTEAFRAAWDTANRSAHDAVLRALREDDDRPVTVDLAPVAAQVKRQLAEDHVPLAARIPVRHTEVALVPADDLSRLRKGYDVLEVAGFWLPVAAVALAAAGIGLAACRRRALTATALGTAVGGALLGVAVAVVRRVTLRGLPTEVSAKAAGAVYDALTETLRTASWMLLTLGLTVAGLTWLLARAGRRRGASVPAPDPTPEPAAPRV
ncbi:hypothetical protein AB0E88_15465 [Streptomyces sp. NPDC028635]|uniref:hypothetical protein n=1 Tax=Streptomyces sp. NPDC028635 TaxID=3154800 RepID=UPI0033CF45FC